VRALVAALVCIVAGSASVRAQELAAPPAYAEYRADAIVTRGFAAEGGAGVVIPGGTYVRVGIDGAAGPTWRDGAVRAGGRVDVIGRFLLDPFREVPYGISLGGGVSVPYVQGDAHLRPYVTVVLDVEGRRRRSGWTPALQLGLGGGARIGVVLRRSPQRYR
jgi:hypothetical protein